MRRWSGVGTVSTLLVILGLVVPAGPAAAQFIIPSSDITALRQAIFSAIANQVGALPQPSGVGFTYKFDPALGVFSPTGEGFGPIFAQRAETIGKGRITLTTSYTRHTFDDIDGQSLRDGDPLGFVFGVAPDASTVRLNLISFKEDVDADVVTIG